MFSDTFAGIAPSSAPGYIGAQLIGAAVGFAIIRYLYPRPHYGQNAEVVLTESPESPGAAPAAAG